MLFIEDWPEKVQLVLSVATGTFRYETSPPSNLRLLRMGSSQPVRQVGRNRVLSTELTPLLGRPHCLGIDYGHGRTHHSGIHRQGT